MDARPQPTQELSNAIVRWYAEKFGRGPTRAKAYIEQDHTTIILGDVQTAVERTLTANGQGALVKEVRRTVKAVYRTELSGIVEQTTGRTVVAMHSDHDPETNTAVYVFLFAKAES
jgi:uncharacterized protein YbcI